MSSSADLASVASTLEQLMARVGGAVDEFTGTADEDVSIALMDVERSLRSANRRLDRLVKELRRRGL
ncbi:MAG: hypothetical protein M9952_12410 [Microthrixaceae bacterium]|nr:hypothetical protein [Microthrixaceae bacterium]MCO5313725.1 hypothetical protein [Microthrixaceae bacterium]HPB45252.1 hypothetical protein [Microthrixaceae bacterium]